MDYDTKTVGQALQQVPISDMIKSYAEGIADAQLALDQKSIALATELLKNKVSLPDGNGALRERTLLELGFAPTFYHFEEATIDISVTLTMKVEQSLSVTASLKGSHGRSTGSGSPSDLTNAADDKKSDPLIDQEDKSSADDNKKDSGEPI